MQSCMDGWTTMYSRVEKMRHGERDSRPCRPELFSDSSKETPT